MTLSEGAIQITFEDAIGGGKFDDVATHGLSHCMKAVDFVVEFTSTSGYGHPTGLKVVERIGRMTELGGKR